MSINISQNYQIQCIVIDEKETEHIIKLNNQNDDYLPITIAFDMNEIVIGKETTNSINFMKEWIDHPEIFKEYQIQYQNKEYTVISELLFALIINEFKKKIEKDFIIDETIVYVPSHDNRFTNRMKISLESVELKNIIINPIEQYLHYQHQGEMLHDIINNYTEYLKYKTIIEKRTKEIQIDNSKPFTEIEYNQLIKQYTPAQRTELRLPQLDNYCIFLASKWFDTIYDHINLTRVCKRLKLNMTKFHFNPIPLTETIREYFPNLQTLYQYHYDDNLFENDERIIARESPLLMNYISTEEKKQLEAWTNKKCSEVLFDSNKDDWSKKTSVFDDKVMNKSNLVFLIEDTDNNKFGYYLSTQIQSNKYDTLISTDKNSFLFSLKSNGRLNGMMKFEIKNTDGGYNVKPKSDNILIQLGYGNSGAIHIKKENSKSQSYCFQRNRFFNYHGTENPLVGGYGIESSQYFTPKRITIIQMN